MKKPDKIVVAALYRFAVFDRPENLQGPLSSVASHHGVKGTLLLAREGINGTIAGSREGIDAVLAHIRTLPGCADIEHKESWAAGNAVQQAESQAEARDRDHGYG